MPAKKTFISYSSKNSDEVTELATFLTPLERDGKITVWSNQDIEVGQETDIIIKQQLAEADIILLLVSSHFLADEPLWDTELKAAIERHERKEATLIPIILRPCDWESAPFAKLKTLPHAKAKTISAYADKDEAWLEVVQAIKQISNSSTNTTHNQTITQNLSTMPQNIITQVQQLIAGSRIKEALDILEKNAHSDMLDAVLLLKARLTKLERGTMLGIMGSSDEGVERNRIVSSALDLCKELSNPPASPNPITPPITQVSYKLPNIRKFLDKALSDVEFSTLCMDYFEEVYNQFSEGQNKGQKINLLLDYCRRNLTFPALLDAMKDMKEKLFEQYQPYQ